jgi:hypothetical protein
MADSLGHSEHGAASDFPVQMDMQHMAWRHGGGSRMGAIWEVMSFVIVYMENTLAAASTGKFSSRRPS